MEGLWLGCTDLDQVMRIYTDLQKKKKMCVIIENFEHAVLPDHRKAKYIEGTIRGYAQNHRNAAWLCFRDPGDAPVFSADDRTFSQSGIIMIEEGISRPEGER